MTAYLLHPIYQIGYTHKSLSETRCTAATIAHLSDSLYLSSFHDKHNSIFRRALHSVRTDSVFSQFHITCVCSKNPLSFYHHFAQLRSFPFRYLTACSLKTFPSGLCGVPPSLPKYVSPLPTTPYSMLFCCYRVANISAQII